MKNSQPTLRFATMSTPLGTLLAATSDKGLRVLRFVAKDIAAEVKDLRAQHAEFDVLEDARSLRPLLDQIEEVLAGRLPAERIALDLVGTPFRKKCWQALVKVPWGATMSYSDLARKAGNPRAIRAAASACANNPIVFVIPCHRILAKGGGLGGYGWGLEMKQALLDRER